VAPLDVSPWRGKVVSVSAGKLSAASRGLAAIDQGDALKGAGDLYQEPLRPQIHFFAAPRWTNDPMDWYISMGTIICLSAQPYGWSWGNMHWGHAVSKDLVHWEERGEALYPDALGPMFSGSAVVDWRNTAAWAWMANRRLSSSTPPPAILAVQCWPTAATAASL